MEDLCLDRVLSQGQLVTNQIHRCLPVALSGLKGGRAARRKLQDTVQVCLPITNVALQVLVNYCKATGKTKAVVVTEIILATALCLRLITYQQGLTSIATNESVSTGIKKPKMSVSTDGLSRKSNESWRRSMGPYSSFPKDTSPAQGSDS